MLERRWLVAAADDARREAHRILAERRFKPATVPRPLRGVLRWVGDRLRPVVEPLGRLVDRVVANRVAMAVLALAVVVLAAVVSLRLIRWRASSGGHPGAPTRRAGAAEDPERLEREADEAERLGELELALRLRFRAGLLRLHRSGAVSLRPSVTSGQLVRQLRSATFRHLATTFDQVTYGRRRVAASDLEAARHDWSRLLEEVTPR